MAKRSASPDKLTIKGLSQDDQEWLKAESERLGCDPENLVRMMIRQRGAPIAPTPPPRGGPYYTDEMPSYEGLISRYDNTPTDDEPSPTLNEAEPSLDALMAASPSILDDAVAAMVPRPARAMPAYDPFAGRGHLYQRPSPRNIVPFRNRYAGGAFGAGSLTRAVGVGNATAGNLMGDGIGNVLRDNMGHYGLVGTRSR